MLHPDQYHLIEFGDGRKVESFAGQVVLRETPSAMGPFPVADELPSAELQYRSHPQGHWLGQSPDPWRLKLDPLDIELELRTTPSGQIGVFPEQAENWLWLKRHSDWLRGKRALNLFAYTGGTTLVLARAGCEVVHVDSAASVVKWARRNAEISELQSAPIRWIVEDACKFVRREVKRGNHYDIIVADPPSFGRGPKGETWKFETDFAELIEDLSQLITPQKSCGVISCHSPGINAKRLKAGCRMLSKPHRVEAFSLELLTQASRRKLASGHCVRWVAGS